MPTLAQVRTTVDARLADLWMNQIQPRQDAHFLRTGKYWQGLVTTQTALIPNNPDDASAVREVAPETDTHPTDQAETWTDAGIVLGSTLPMAIRVDVYDGPLGKGYVGVVYARWDTTIYVRSHNSGPETWRTDPWRIDPELTAQLQQALAEQPATEPRGFMARAWSTVRSWFA
jgi:hypothetical protein